MRRALAALALAAALLTPAQGAQAFVHSVKIWDGAGGTGAFCGGIASQSSNMASLGGCGNWDNRASSFQANILVGQCIAFYSGTSWTGLMAWTAGTGVANLPAGLDNAASSLRFGVPGGGTCGAPWS